MYVITVDGDRVYTFDNRELAGIFCSLLEFTLECKTFTAVLKRENEEDFVLEVWNRD